MSLAIHFKYRDADSTQSLNDRLRQLIGRGIYYGGLLSYSAGSATVTRSSFLAVGYDGCTVSDDESGSLTFTSNGTWYHVVRAKYNALGSPSIPTLSEEYLSAAQLAADADTNYLIRFGEITVAGGVITAISYANRDVIDAIGRSNLRGVVAAIGDLPTPTPTTNQVGDVYFVSDNYGFYWWNGTTWGRVIASGAGSRDGAYDDGTGSGAGRTAYIDSQAALDVQSSGGQRANDIANAVYRIDKTGETINGGVGIDIKVKSDRDIGSLFIRSLYVDGANIQADEACSIAAGAAVTLTRPTNMSAAQGKRCSIIEITGTSNSQDGVYLYTRTGVAAGTITNLDGTSPVTVIDSGVANFFEPRFVVGSMTNSGTFPLIGGPAGMVFYGGSKANSYGFVHLFDASHTQVLREFMDIGSGGVNYIEEYKQPSAHLYVQAYPAYYLIRANVTALASLTTYNQHASGYGLEVGAGSTGGAINYHSSYQVSKWITPTWEVYPHINGGSAAGWYRSSTWAYRCDKQNQDMVWSTTDWPEGCRIKEFEVIWYCANNTGDLYLEPFRTRIDNTSMTDLALKSGGGTYQPSADGATKYDSGASYEFDQNYGAGAGAGITTAWSHGGTALTDKSDKLVFYFYTLNADILYMVYNVRIKIEYRSVNKWDGRDYV